MRPGNLVWLATHWIGLHAVDKVVLDSNCIIRNAVRLDKSAVVVHLNKFKPYEKVLHQIKTIRQHLQFNSSYKLPPTVKE